MKKIFISILSAIIVLLGGYTVADNYGSITTGQEYKATTTTDGAGVIADTNIKDGWGTLGSLVITKAGDTAFSLIDASSTIMTYDDFPTTTLAEIPASLAAGTYVFDVEYQYGLYLDVSAGTTGSSTITFR